MSEPEWVTEVDPALEPDHGPLQVLHSPPAAEPEPDEPGPEPDPEAEAG
jgi:hypothetical protein